MIDKTNNTKDISLRYISPKIKEIEVTAQNVLCQSGNTEKFNKSDYSYGEDDWS